MVMKKLNRPTGLIRYASLNQMNNIKAKRLLQRPLVLLSILLITASIFATVYGVSNMSAAEFNVVSSRQPMYVLMSDNSVQNRYQIRIFNKTDQDHQYRIGVEGKSGFNAEIKENTLRVKAHEMATKEFAVRIARTSIQQDMRPITFKAHNLTDKSITLEYQSVFKSSGK